MINNTTRGERIRIARKSKNLTLLELAHLTGTKTWQVIQYEETEKRRSNLSLLVKIADVCNVSLEWLVTGKGESTACNQDIYPIKKHAPIIEWHEICKWKAIGEKKMISEKETVALINNESSNCFGLKVMDDAMVSSNSYDNSFIKNDIIIIDPDAKAAIGDYVIISPNENEMPVLRLFLLTPVGAIFKALNNDYESYSATDSIIVHGTVVGQYRNFYKKA